MGWPQPPSHQLFLWLFLWGGPSLPVTNYIPLGWPQPPNYQLFLWLLLWGGPSLPVNMAPASVSAIFMGWPQPPIYQLFLGLFLWRVLNLLIISYFSGYFYSVAVVSAS